MSAGITMCVNASVPVVITSSMVIQSSSHKGLQGVTPAPTSFRANVVPAPTTFRAVTLTSS